MREAKSEAMEIDNTREREEIKEIAKQESTASNDTEVHSVAESYKVPGVGDTGKSEFLIQW